MTTERTMGAALATVAVVSSQAPPKIDTEKTTSLRNRAVHAGDYPKDPEAEAMCLEIERLIYECELRMEAQTCVNPRTYWDVAIHEEIDEEIARQQLKGSPGVKRVFGTVLASNRPQRSKTFTAVRRLADYRKSIAEDAVHWQVW